MNEHTLFVLLLVGFASVAAWPLYVAVEKVVRWILNGATQDCSVCTGTGFIQPHGGLYWRCTACEGVGEVAVLS